MSNSRVRFQGLLSEGHYPGFLCDFYNKCNLDYDLSEAKEIFSV